MQVSNENSKPVKGVAVFSCERLGARRHSRGGTLLLDVLLTPVVGGCEENGVFFTTMPRGRIELETLSPSLADLFEAGEEYTVTIERRGAR